MCLKLMASDKFESMFSFVFNPAVMTAFAFIILMYPLEGVQASLVLAICITFGTLVPLGMMYHLSKQGLISDFYVSEKKERTKPFAGAIVSYIVGSVVLLLVRAPAIVTALMLCTAGNSVIMMLITFRWKISIHASGIAGPVTTLVYATGAWAAVLFLLLIPVGWARVRLRAHTPWQIFAGALVTIISTWIQLIIYFSIL